MDIILKENERIDDLEFNNLKIIQNKKRFCFGIDSVLISNFVKGVKDDAKILDLGSGTGIISILLAGKKCLKNITGVEIQKEVAEMSQRSIELNNLQRNIKIINDDIKNLNKYFKKCEIDAIVTNPPYQKNKTGLKNEDEYKLISRHEVKCNLEDIIKVSSELLKDKGKFFMVHRAERIADIMFLLKKYNMEPKELQIVCSNKNTKPKLVLIEAVKNANEFLKVNNILYVYNDDGNYTDEILKIYGKI